MCSPTHPSTHINSDLTIEDTGLVTRTPVALGCGHMHNFSIGGRFLEKRGVVIRVYNDCSSNHGNTILTGKGPHKSTK